MDDEEKKRKQEKGIRFQCKRCGNQSFKEKHLCKPISIEELQLK